MVVIYSSYFAACWNKDKDMVHGLVIIYNIYIWETEEGMSVLTPTITL